MLTQCEETVSLKVEGIEQLKWQLEAAQQELLLFKDQVCFSIDFFDYHNKHLYGHNIFEKNSFTKNNTCVIQKQTKYMGTC